MPIAPVEPAGNLATFNMQHGFVEAMVRGMRLGFLSDTEYHHLTQCESLEDLKLNMQETDYDQFLANEANVTPAIIQSQATKKLVDEWTFLKAQADEPLVTFLDYISYEYMIDNVCLLLKGSLSGRPVSELLQKCHPLGNFKESVMKSIPNFEASAKGIYVLYQLVLIDTPIAPYFEKFLSAKTDASAGNQDFDLATDMKEVFEEVEIMQIKSALMKLYLEDFYDYCMKVGGDTATVMGELIKARADRMAINIVLNSFNTPLNDVNLGHPQRAQILPSVGFLYPGVTLQLNNVSDEGSLEKALQGCPIYHTIYQSASQFSDKSIDDAFSERDVQMLELAFEGQMHFGVFYAYIKLKEQEIRNLYWISECILQMQKDEINKFVPIFSENAPWRLDRK